MQELADILYDLINQISADIWLIKYIVAITWAFNLINWSIGSIFLIFGLWPRKLWGLTGVLFSPILHGNFNHLFFNTIPFVALGIMMLSFGAANFIILSSLISITENLIVWLIGRNSIHIGASGLVSGYFGFLLGFAYANPSIISFAVIFILIYYFGAILAGLLPLEEQSSWESHLAGFLSGVLFSYLSLNSLQFNEWIEKLALYYF